jgi:hypothetical protein
MNWKGEEGSDCGLILSYFPGIGLKGVRETMKSLDLERVCQTQDSKSYPPEYNSELLPLETTWPVTKHIPSWLYPDYIYMTALHSMTLRWQQESPIWEWAKFLMFDGSVSADIQTLRWKCLCMLDSSPSNFNFTQLCVMVCSWIL